MYSREELGNEISRCLEYSPEQAAVLHVQRQENGWDLMYGYWPLNTGSHNITPVVDEVQKLFNAHIVRRGMTAQMFEIDPCSIGYQQLSAPDRAAQLRRGAGIWLPVKVDLTTEVE